MDSKHFKTDKNRQIEKNEKKIYHPTGFSASASASAFFFFPNMALWTVQLHVAIGHLTEFSQVCVSADERKD